LEERDNLHALTSLELQSETVEHTAPGRRVKGVGLGRVSETDDVNWVFLRCNDIPRENCPRHEATPMILYRVKSHTGLNIKGTLFYRCDVKLGGILESGYPRICGSNVYFVYLRHLLEEELERENVNDRPLVIANMANVPRE
jgi:hypothetical protein